jgi:hypothetical protein
VATVMALSRRWDRVGRILRHEHARRVVAATFAAIAESGLIFLPLMEFTSESVQASGGPLMTYPVVAVLFVIGVAVGSALSRLGVFTTTLATGALLLGFAQGLEWGNGDIAGTIFVAVLMLLVGARVVTLAARDWRDPVKGSFGWGAVVVFAEIVLVGVAQPLWRHLLPLVVGQFFLGSLASRAVSVLAVDRVVAATSGRMGRRRAALPVAALGVLAVVMAGAVLLGRRHGVLQAAGGLVVPAVLAVIMALAWVLAQILLGPVSWLFVKLHISLDPLRSLAHRLTFKYVRPNTTQKHGLDITSIERVIGMALLLGLAWVLIRYIRRRWRAPEPKTPIEAEAGRLGGVAVESTWWSGVHPPRLRRELPADTVRRWYAEAMLLLERKGLAKPPSRTPAEYLADVCGAFPESGAGFEVLTRAYEDVRYGEIIIDRRAIRGLERERETMMDRLRKAPKLKEPEEAGARAGLELDLGSSDEEP